MVIRYNRDQMAERIKKTLNENRAVIASGAGTGLSAKCAELGGADLIIIYNSGLFRMDGMPSVAGILCYSNANDVVYQMGERHVLPVVKETPVIAGVCGTDPTRDMNRFLDQLQEVGFSGVINFPTVGRIDGVFRRDLESVGLGFSREVEMIAKDTYSAGSHQILWNGRDHPSGIYFVSLSGTGFHHVRKTMLLR